MESERCFVCRTPTTTGDSEKQSLLKSQLNAVFVLRKLLDLPLELLERYFGLSGGEDPAKWITICGGQCQEIVDKAQSAYEEMCRARQKFEICQLEIRSKIKISSSTSLLHSAANQQKDYKTEIWKSVWDNVLKKENTLPVFQPDDLTEKDEITEQLLPYKVTHISKQSLQLSPVMPKLEVVSLSKFGDAEKNNGSDLDVSPAILSQRDQTLYARRSLTNHEGSGLQRHESKKFNCDRCVYSTNYKKNLNRHVETKHEKSRSFICEICQSMFYTSENLRRHQAYNHNKCLAKNCGKMYGSEQQLRFHQITCHGQEVNMFKCPKCELLFKQMRFLKEHLKVFHSNGNEHAAVCDQCGKTFLTKHRLQRHIRSVHKKREKINLEKE